MVQPGMILKSNFRIVRYIKEGGQAAVYEAVNIKTGLRVAIKETIFNRDLPQDVIQESLAREWKLLKSLKHQGLPKVYDFFVEGNAAFLVMEYIAGDDLQQMLEQHGFKPFGIEEIFPWAYQLMDIVQYLHGQRPPIIHRDIKPANLKLSEAGQIRLLDFGVSKDMSSKTLVYSASRHYSPLEQLLGLSTDERSDVYSVTATLYCLLTGKAPDDAELARNTAMNNNRPDPLEPVNQKNPDISHEVSNVLMRGMTLRSAERIRSIDELRRELKEAVTIDLRPSKPLKSAPVKEIEQPRQGKVLQIDVIRHKAGEQYITPSANLSLRYDRSSMLQEDSAGQTPTNTIWVESFVLLALSGVAAFIVINSLASLWLGQGSIPWSELFVPSYHKFGPIDGYFLILIIACSFLLCQFSMDAKAGHKIDGEKTFVFITAFFMPFVVMRAFSVLLALLS